MTHTDDAFWTALVARLTELRWCGAPAIAAGLLPRHPDTPAGALPRHWPGRDGGRGLLHAGRGLSRRMQG